MPPQPRRGAPVTPPSPQALTFILVSAVLFYILLLFVAVGGILSTRPVAPEEEGDTREYETREVLEHLRRVANTSHCTMRWPGDLQNTTFTVNTTTSDSNPPHTPPPSTNHSNPPHTPPPSTNHSNPPHPAPPSTNDSNPPHPVPPSTIFTLLPKALPCDFKLADGDDLLFIFILSQFDHSFHRHLIRTTWASHSSYAGAHLSFYFVVGHPHIGSAQGYQSLDLRREQRDLEREAARYDDIIQVATPDEYRTLTLKHLATLSYQQRHCPEATWVVKVDEDVFLNPVALVDYLKTEDVRGYDLVCPWLEHDPKHPPVPHRTGKWAVTVDEYPFRSFPFFCHGQMYAYRGDLAREMFRVSQDLPCHLWLEDVYVSGVLAAAANGTHQPLSLLERWQDIPTPGQKGSGGELGEVSWEERGERWYIKAALDHKADITQYRRQLRVLWARLTKSKYYREVVR